MKHRFFKRRRTPRRPNIRAANIFASRRVASGIIAQQRNNMGSREEGGKLRCGGGKYGEGDAEGRRWGFALKQGVLSIGREKRASRTKRTEGRVRHSATQRTRILPRYFVPVFAFLSRPSFPGFFPSARARARARGGERGASSLPALSRVFLLSFGKIPPQPPCGPEISLAGLTEINENSSMSLTKRKHNLRNCGNMQRRRREHDKLNCSGTPGNKGPTDQRRRPRNYDISDISRSRELSRRQSSPLLYTCVQSLSRFRGSSRPLAQLFELSHPTGFPRYAVTHCRQ